MITVRNLTRKFGAQVAVEDLSFHLEAGEVVGFLGPNGAGKTTTMRILAGYLPATGGSASVCGLDVLRESLAVRQSIGYLPESVPLYREHRVTEMLDFQGRLHGMSRSERKARIPEVLEKVGIADRSRAIIGTLSRGQRQRVGLAVALLPDPKVLLLDEPTSGLDPLQRLEVRKLLLELARAHTVLLSSHILSEVEAVCPRVIILNRGRIAADGTKEELVKKLGGGSFVRFEAMVGSDVAGALRAIKSLRGVRDAIDRGRLGIHQVFSVQCDEDLREDLGALAMQRKWAIRELSWARPTLEDIFARIALDLGEHPNAESLSSAPAETSNVVGAQPNVAAQSGVAAQPNLAAQTGVAAQSGVAAGGLSVLASAPAAKKIVYNLNPFDQGAARDLSKPKAIDATQTTTPGLDEPRDGEKSAKK